VRGPAARDEGQGPARGGELGWKTVTGPHADQSLPGWLAGLIGCACGWITAA
jgi:hypothetical protein